MKDVLFNRKLMYFPPLEKSVFNRFYDMNTDDDGVIVRDTNYVNDSHVKYYSYVMMIVIFVLNK